MEERCQGIFERLKAEQRVIINLAEWRELKHKCLPYKEMTQGYLLGRLSWKLRDGRCPKDRYIYFSL